MRKKRTSILIFAQLIVLTGIILSATFSATPITNKSTEHIVEMHKRSFKPDKSSVKVGDTIRFVNKSKLLHNVVVPKLKIRTKFVKKGKSVTIKIKQAGTFEYYCAPHRSMGMTGTIISKE